MPQKIVESAVFSGIFVCHLDAHPVDSSALVASGDNQLVATRFCDDSKELDGTTIRNDLHAPISNVCMSSSGEAVFCAANEEIYKLEVEGLRGCGVSVVQCPPTCIRPYPKAESGADLVVADENGEVHLIDSRTRPLIKVHSMESQSDGNEIRDMAVKDATLYTVTENGVVAAYDLRKRAFSRKLEFESKFFTSDFHWIDMKQGYVAASIKRTDYKVERMEVLDDDLILAKQFTGKELILIDRSARQIQCLVDLRQEILDISTTNQTLFAATESPDVDLTRLDAQSLHESVRLRRKRPQNAVDPDFFDGL